MLRKIYFHFVVCLACFILSACGGGSDSSPTQSVNQLPFANAGSDVGVRIFGSVVLDGTSSRDPDGSIQSYAWRQKGNIIYPIFGSDTATPRFEPGNDTPEEFEIELTVTDNQGATSIDTVTVFVTDITADAGSDFTEIERAENSLVGSAESNKPISTYSWEQIAGTSAQIVDASSQITDFILPSLQVPETLTFSLTATDETGATHSDTVDVEVNVYPDIAELNISNKELNDCLLTIADANGYEDANEFTEIICEGVNDISGIFQLSGLTSAAFPNSNIENIDELIELTKVSDLSIIDLTGNNNIPCEQIEYLETFKTDIDSYAFSEDCRMTSQTRLSGHGHDIAIDEMRGLVYVSIPNKKEIVLVDIESRRKVQKIIIPGAPRDLDISKDKSSLFVALYESNAVAVIDLNDLSFRVIPLEESLSNEKAAEIAQIKDNQLLVTSTTAPSGGGYIANVVLANEAVVQDSVARVNGSEFTRSVSPIVVSRDGNFAYIAGERYPQSIYKLDISSDVPLHLNEFEVIGNYSSMALNVDGSKLALSSG